MPFLTVKIQPGVKTVATPTLLNANVVASNLIRWRGGLPEKYGGWMNFFTPFGSPTPSTTTVPGIVRDMWAWADLDLTNHLAVAGTAGLQVITPAASSGGPSTIQDISPQYLITSTANSFGTGGGGGANLNLVSGGFVGSTQLTLSPLTTGQSLHAGWNIYDGQIPSGPNAGQTSYSIPMGTIITAVDLSGTNPVVTISNAVVAGIYGGVASTTPMHISGPATTMTVTDPGIVLNSYCSAQFLTHVGLPDGQILFGSFPITDVASNPDSNLGPNQYAMPLPPGWWGASGGSHVFFSTSAGSPLVRAGFIDIRVPYQVGDTFTIAYPSDVGGITIPQGFYEITSITDFGKIFYFNMRQPALSADAQWEGYKLAPGGGQPNGPASTKILYWIAQGPPPNYNPIPPGNPYPPQPTDPDYGASWLGTVTTDDWSLANFGSKLISSPRNGPLFVWDPTLGTPNSQMIGGAPTASNGFFIGMPEQQIICYGGSTLEVEDPMLVAWCDNADYNTWTAGVDNQAGTYRLSRGSKIVGGIQGPQQALLWTDVGLWTMAYIGYPNVFGFTEIAQGCGLIAKHAVGVYGPQVFWMGRDSFWVYGGGAVTRLQCDVWDVIFKNLNNTRNANGDYIYLEHIRSAVNSDYDEVAWHFPSQAATNGENDSFVKFNTVTGEWDYSLSNPQQGMVGATPMHVTEWIDQNIFGHPLSTMLGQTAITAPTSAATASGGTTLTFAPAPSGFLDNMAVTDVTHPSAIAAGTLVSGIITHVTLNVPVEGVGGPTGGVHAGDHIQFLSNNTIPSTGIGLTINAYTSAQSLNGSYILTFTDFPSGVVPGMFVINRTPGNTFSIPNPCTVSSLIADQITLSAPTAAAVNSGDVIQVSGPNSSIMQHEMGTDANGQPINWMMQTGFFMLSDGEDKVFVDFMLPDFRWRRWQQPQSTSATVQITLYTAEEPDDPLDQWVPYGPFIVTNASGAVEVRCRGRYFFASIQGNDLGSFVRLGGIKFRAAPDGRN